MDKKYNEFLRRMIEYRTHLNVTQEEVSRKIGLTQSQYSKMELGKTIFPYDVLYKLSDIAWDTNYLLTGQQSITQSCELIEIVEANIEYEKDILPVLIWLLDVGMRKSSIPIDNEMKCELDIFEHITRAEESPSLLLEIRNVLHFSQLMMAEKLGVNIKKYRLLEREEIKPDAELLIKIHELAGCKPGLLLQKDNVKNTIMNDIWNRILPSVRGSILEYLGEAILLLKS